MYMLVGYRYIHVGQHEQPVTTHILWGVPNEGPVCTVCIINCTVIQKITEVSCFPQDYTHPSVHTWVFCTHPAELPR